VPSAGRLFCAVWYACEQSSNHPQVLNQQSINQSINQYNNGEIEQTINPFNNGEIEPSITGDPAAASLASRSSDRLVMSASFLSSSSLPLAHSARSCLERQGERSGAARECGVTHDCESGPAVEEFITTEKKSQKSAKKSTKRGRERMMVFT